MYLYDIFFFTNFIFSSIYHDTWRQASGRRDMATTMVTIGADTQNRFVFECSRRCQVDENQRVGDPDDDVSELRKNENDEIDFSMR